MQYGIFHIRVMEIWMQIILQKIWKLYFTYQNMVTGFLTWYDFFSYFSYEKLCVVFPSWNTEYCLVNIRKTFINLPTRNVAFAHRFPCLRYEILYISIKKVWTKVFWYEIWNSVYFTFEDLGEKVLIWNMKS